MYVRSTGTLFSVGYSENLLQNIQDIRKNTQYQAVDVIFTSPNTFSQV